MTRLAAAVLLGTSLLLGRAAAASSPGVPDDLRYWYLDIYEPFFQLRTSSGTPELVSERPGSQPARLAPAKPPGVFRVFLVGGSVANRFESPPPADAGARLSGFLQKAMPGKTVEVVNCGMNGYDSYRDSLVFDEILGRGPDLIVLMSGNNDFSESAGPPPLKVRTALRLRGMLGLQARLERGPALEGHARTMAEYREQFAGNLRAMARAAKAAKVPLVLCTLPRRLGQPPSGPLPLWERAFFDAWLSWEKRDLAAAEAGFADELRKVPDDNMARYYIGRCREARGDAAGAREAYRKALMPDVNEVIRQAARQEGTLLADLEAVFIRASGGPRLEREFSDTVHWLRGLDPLVSDAVSRAATGREPPAERSGPPPALVPEPFEARLLAAFWEAASGALGQAEDRSRPLEAAVWMLEALWDEEPSRMERFQDSKESLRARYLGNPSHIGGKEGFERLWTAGLAHLGEAAARKGRLAAALRSFAGAIAAAPDSPAARLRLAVWLARSGRKTEARLAFRKLAPWKDRLPEAGWYREALSIPEGD